MAMSPPNVEHPAPNRNRTELPMSKLTQCIGKGCGIKLAQHPAEGQPVRVRPFGYQDYPPRSLIHDLGRSFW